MSADFEKQLQRHPLRELPRDWRDQILATASVPRSSTWPSPRAWASLSAVWLVTFLLHLTAPDEPRHTRNSPATSMQSFAILHQQTLSMAQLLGQTDLGETPAALPAPPKPRSEITRKQLLG